ncbi:hypothetical protein T4B_14376 [Trichinella pseudospiralis]|uniref:Uncharacterized protein n=1 Tax=Trichinella pseudospiralis TaxID=6337 RepID=A0A0V1KA16_TRIPS|nr:hypothetical protein T4A_480 [Trichinella pseudospiralis]KRZ12736.1 hypothetical protein T4B_14376 [Trichinella pseudospiralis]KRZ44081.1 hypothetical protein T4C_6507 [Trichinella pseudospiralis]
MVCSSIGRNSCEEQSFQMMLKQTIWLRTQFETLLLYDCASVEHYFKIYAAYKGINFLVTMKNSTDCDYDCTAVIKMFKNPELLQNKID